MSAIFESLKKLDQKDKVLGVIEADPPHAEKAERSSAGRWISLMFVFLGVALAGLAYFSHIKFQELNGNLSSQHAAFIGRFDQLTRDLTNLEQQVASLESGQKAGLSRQSRLSEELEKERQAWLNGLEKQSQDIRSLQTQFDERFDLLSQRIAAIEEPTSRADSNEQR